MKNLVIVATVFCAALASCQGSKSISSFNTIDSLSYSAGVQFATNIRMQDSTLNGAVIGAAFKDVFEGKGKMTMEEATTFINEWFRVRKPAQNKAESTAWLEKEKAGNSNIQTTESGLMYEIVNEGDMSARAVNDADQVVVYYRGTLKDGREFDRNDSISFPLSNVIPAWTEGMKLVGKGGEITLWAPAELAYGEAGRMPIIEPNQALKFEVRLLDVIPAAVESAE